MIRRLCYFQISSFCLLFFFLIGSAQAQSFSGGFNFYLPPQDTTSQRFLPQFSLQPIGDTDFVTVDADGHFTVGGKATRFFGVNSVADGAFPAQSKAWFVAGRLRKMGFNLVRFHHLDNPWSSGSLFVSGQSTRHLNPTTLDRLEKYISELKKNGVYANINLHVSRTINAQDGIPAADSILNYGKGVSYFDPLLLPLYQEYARQLLRHINPYTGLSLVNDPVMAMVEITNENSLYRLWRDDQLKPFARGGDLTVRHQRILDSLWQDYLITKYGDTNSLSSAWNQGVRPAGSDEQIYDGGFETDPLLKHWQLELHSPAQGAMGIEATAPYAGKFSARVVISQTDAVDWHVQWKQIGLTIRQDSLYTVRFAARADANRTIALAIMQESSPWTVFFSASFALTPQWQTFSLNFRAAATCEHNTRLSFQLGGATGSYWFDDIHFAASAITGLANEESLAARSVQRIDYSQCSAYSDVRVQDQSAFYLKLQNDFFSEMVRFLKTELGVKVPIVGTNWNVGPVDLAVQSQLDYIDNHSYWDHPQFPNIPWSTTDWLINNNPMVLVADGGTIPYLMGGVGFQGKPFTVSEYNHAFPNRYQSEGVLFITSYAAFHDVDGILFFDYGGDMNDWESDAVTSYFSIHRNSAMMALMPSCAIAYREGMIAPAQERILLNYSEPDLLLLPKYDNRDWRGPEIFTRLLALQHSVRYASFASAATTDFSTLPPEPNNPYTTDTDQITWDTGGLLKTASPKFVGMTGFLSRYANQIAGDLELLTASGFATLTWVSLTSESLAHSERSLLTISTRLQNTGMVWDGNSTVHDHWGGAPTLLEAATLTLRFHLSCDSIRIYPLDPTGAQGVAFRTYLPDSSGFNVTFDQNQQKTVWFGVECFGQVSAEDSNDSHPTLPTDFSIEQNYPNPFAVPGEGNAVTHFRYFLPSFGNVELTIFDLLGRRIRNLTNRSQPIGSHSFIWDGKDEWGQVVDSGVYFYRIEAEVRQQQFRQTKKLILLR